MAFIQQWSAVLLALLVLAVNLQASGDQETTDAGDGTTDVSADPCPTPRTSSGSGCVLTDSPDTFRADTRNP